jgi:hypothetical protein
MNLLKKIILPYILTFFLLFSFGTLFLDLFKNPETTRKLIHIGSDSLFIISISSILIMGVIGAVYIPQRVQSALKYFACICISLSTILTIINSFTYSNFIYSKTLINVDKLMEIGILSLWVWIWSHSFVWLQTNRKSLFFSGGWILLGLIFIASLWSQSFFETLSHEDNIIENAQFIALITGSVFAFLTGLQVIKKHTNTFLGIIYILLSVGLFFVAGDEISWGQRIFNIESSAYFLINNSQQETTVHNLGKVGGMVPYLYILIGCYGAFAHFFLSKLQKRIPHLFRFIIPSLHFFPYFYAAFFYNLITTLVTGHTLGVYSESAELMLYLGITLFIIDRFQLLKS